MKKLILVLFVLMLAGCNKGYGDCMAVEFTGVNAQGIQFQDVTAVDGLAQKTISFWTNLDDIVNGDTLVSKYSNVTGYGWYVHKTALIAYTQQFSGTNGIWAGTTNLTTGQWYHVAITYDNSGTANNPAFYLNGSLDVTDEISTPEGTINSDNSNNIELGYISTIANSTVDGKLQDVRIYNRILSASEIETLAKGRCQNQVLGGLVFWAPLNGAQGLRKFEGAAIGATNYLREMTTGALGTAVGSPLGAGNTIQRIK